MSAITRFLSLGMQDADRRIAAALTPRPLAPVDRYLKESVIVRTIDRATERLQAWWLACDTRPVLWSVAATASGPSWRTRYQGVATVVLIAVLVHVSLTLIQGPRPGWFWSLIPALAAALAVLLLAGSRSSSTP